LAKEIRMKKKTGANLKEGKSIILFIVVNFMKSNANPPKKKIKTCQIYYRL